MKEKLIKHIVKFSAYPINYTKLRSMEEEQLQSIASFIDANRFEKNTIEEEFLSYVN